MNGHMGKWNGTKGVHYSKNLVPEKIRYPDVDVETIPNGGWHYSYFGGVNRIISKLNSFAHQEFNTPFYKDKERLNSVISTGEDLFNRDGMKVEYVTDCTYPKLVSENLEKYKEYIYAV
jgi:beta-1,4-mannosyl-glycoprotein beta-1,4-N-acetylglucosaminyltransferase